MANGRRCFSGKVTESDAFYALPGNAQALYLHLCMQADDDGFLNNAAVVASRIYGGRKALKRLVEDRFLLQFGDVCVIKHWRVSNTLKGDRIKNLAFPSIARDIWVRPDRAYTDQKEPGCVSLYTLRVGKDSGTEAPTDGIQNGTDWIPNQSKENIIKDNIRKENRIEEKGTKEKGTKEEALREWREILKNYPSERTPGGPAARR